MAEHADLVEIPPAPSQLVEDEPGIAEARFGRLAQLVLGDLNRILDPSARKLHGGLKSPRSQLPLEVIFSEKASVAQSSPVMTKTCAADPRAK
ncbi:hypothetical protein OG698_40800 [Streptomyces sp. NBC_01003]|uniref:hypothetical protein n=1 Tax=Streptomyces sp. NBC_01003 TaxID=2903714 RepID=UPI003865865E|nr:hypothetical protein OG698_40800 [Streptomyces sp. NBC_01003]